MPFISRDTISSIGQLQSELKLKTRFSDQEPDVLVHTFSNVLKTREEHWRREHLIDSNGYGLTFKETCIKGEPNCLVRAVREFPEAKKRQSELIRELEGLALFSRPEV
jgi:hypothetical protein